MPVFYEVNQRTGFIFEKGLEVDTSRSKLHANPLQLFKILSDIWPKSVSEFEDAMQRIESQHRLAHLTPNIREWIKGGFPFVTQ
ncbi:hypothetical protein L905_11825 [Agrobacterium sp. TS43]|nr:hypothetical protein L906_22050 [Agrobacterium sp. TS45]KVK66304.1 hypothetical protein L907_22010 [Agrobacterium sp. C13]KVK70226.1 hypothetical protein L905_11825 [Agrobacterium sp. TS43]